MAKALKRRFDDSWIPLGAYWSTPFVRWQGSFASAHPVKLAADVGRRALEACGVDPTSLDSVILGTTVPSKASFFGAPWYATLIGAPGIGGPTVAQACATSATALAMAAADIEAGAGTTLVVACDRTSNGPVIYYPDPSGPGGMGDTERWVWDNFNNDPTNNSGGIEMAERLAAEAGITRDEQDQLTALRYEQYWAETAESASVRAGFLQSPVEVKNPSGRRVIATVTKDEGVSHPSLEELRALRTVMPEGTVTSGTQTHPADANCGVVVTSRDEAVRLGRSGRAVQVIGFGQARARTGFLGESTVLSAAAALAAAGIDMGDVRVIKTHNPFAVHDVYFAKQFGLSWEKFNNHGSSLVYGHPNGATGMRGIMEVIEELANTGGGIGLFSGCAAGDTGAAVVVRLEE
jgi:acetyl-CoA acetyltransferase